VEAMLLGKFKPTIAVDETELLNLPDYLRKTYLLAIKLGNATACQVAAGTKRSRAVESKYLNQLVLMQKLEKRHDGRKVVFYKTSKAN
jgi:hypothetical protein